VVKLLIAAKADVDTVDKYGATPLSIALEHGQSTGWPPLHAIAEILRKAGAKE
jgi:ankyrin repeat protein